MATLTALPIAGTIDSPALSAREVLAAARRSRAVADAEEARILDLAATWADLHPPESIHLAASFPVPGGESEEPIAGQGCPTVAEFCIAELGTVLGMSTTSAKRVIGHALELRHRLPRLWRAVQTGRVPAWRAGLVAEATIHATPALTVEAARWVDAQVAHHAGRVGPAQLDRLVAEAIARHGLHDATTLADLDPDHGGLAGPSTDPRHATLASDHIHYAGTMHLEAELSIADALDLDHTLGQHAALLKDLGSGASLDVRRAQALGDLARLQTSLDLAGLSGASDVDPTTLPVARRLDLHLHFNAENAAIDPTGRLEEHQRLLLLDQVKSWCGDSSTQVVVKPVIDLNIRLTADSHAIPDRLRDQAVLRDRTCVFPWCSRPARRCQIDHVVAFDHHAHAGGEPQPGPTASDNLGCLCTFHHRLKTHGRWRYRVTGPGTYEWTSPHGHTYRRDPDGGTTALDPPDLTSARSDLPRP